MSVKNLRKMTNMPVHLCAQAWKDSGEDLDKAVEMLKTKGADKIQKLQDRETKAGFVGVYRHHDGRSVGMVELLCETDFVANTAEFRELANDFAMQVSAEDPVPSPGGFLELDFWVEDGKRTTGEALTELSVKTGEKITLGKMFSHKVCSQ